MRKALGAGLVFLISAAGLQAAEYHVATTGKDTNPGTGAQPFRTIQHAADIAQPGDTITVHAGTYRERIDPPRGGDSDAKRIVYQAAPGEKVEIKGSEPVKNWVKVQGDVWKVTLPSSYFPSFNPYSDLIHGDWFAPLGRVHHTGAVYLNGDWLEEAAKLDDVLNDPGAGLPPAGSYLMNVAWIRPANSGERVDAANFAAKQGIQAASCSEGGQCIGYIKDRDWVRYDHIDFGKGTTAVEIRAASATGGGDIEIRADSASGALLGTCAVGDTGDWQTWTTFKATIKPVSGVRSICLVFRFAPHGSKPLLWFGQVSQKNTTIWAQFKGIDPNEQFVEINVRQTVFYPKKTGINFITVRGFIMCDAATPWAPPTAGQIGLIGPNWSKGWIIENNKISYSTCSGISLGKYSDQWDNTSADSADGYVQTIHRALANGWNKATIGDHLVRNNEISHCEQCGIVGSLGCAFSTITGNSIHDIHVRRLFTGAEMAGIKFHGAVDVEISHNHIYRTDRGIWLDWMAQGSRVTSNLFHDNRQQDVFFEVDHGPFLVDNNNFLSHEAVMTASQGGAFVHNLFAGTIDVLGFDGRQTPFLKAHSTEIAGMHNNPSGDVRFYNNIFAQNGGDSGYDKAPLQVWMQGNVFLKGTHPSSREINSLLKPAFDPAIKLVENAGAFYLNMMFDDAWSTEQSRQIVTSEMLGKASIPDLPFERADGTPYRIDTDYLGRKRNASNPMPGPFENPGQVGLNLKVW